MTNWWTLTAALTEITGAFLIAQGLAGEKPSQWVQGRGTPRWDLGPDADLNYAAGATDAAIGFCVLVAGLTVQALSALDASAHGSPWLLLVPLAVVTTAEPVRRRRRLRRERAVIQLRLTDMRDRERAGTESGASVVRGYSRALANVGRRRLEGEDHWTHLDRVYGTDAWVPPGAVAELRHAYSTFPLITDLRAIGDLWLPWFVQRDDPATPIRNLNRDTARQLRVRDVIDDPAVAPALAIEDMPPGGAPVSHRSRINDYIEQWRNASSVGPGPFPAYRTPEGPMLRDGCHRCCAIYALNLPDSQVSLELSDPPAGHPDTHPGPRG